MTAGSGEFLLIHYLLFTTAGSGGLFDLDFLDRHLWRDFASVCVFEAPSRYRLGECGLHVHIQ
jgi:hypothetical protein